LFHHPDRHIEYNTGLLPVCGTSVYLAAMLEVAARKQQRNRGGKFGFALFLGYLYLGRVKLPVSVGFEYPEYVADDLLLPIYEVKRCAVPFALCMV
jgi:hypothetical protein